MLRDGRWSWRRSARPEMSSGPTRSRRSRASPGPVPGPGSGHGRPTGSSLPRSGRRANPRKSYQTVRLRRERPGRLRRRERLVDSAEYGLALRSAIAEAEALGVAVDLVEAGVPATASEAKL